MYVGNISNDIERGPLTAAGSTSATNRMHIPGVTLSFSARVQCFVSSSAASVCGAGGTLSLVSVLSTGRIRDSRRPAINREGKRGLSRTSSLGSAPMSFDYMDVRGCPSHS